MNAKRFLPFFLIPIFSLGLIVGTLAFAKSAESDASASDAVTSAAQAAIEFTKTVGLDPAQCAPTHYAVSYDGIVTYCYRVTNTGPVTLTVHDLTDSELGTILTAFPYTLTPGSSFYITQTVELTETTVNTATWRASNPDLSEIISDTDSATVHLLAVCPLGHVPKKYEATNFSSFPAPGWTITNTTTGCSGIPDWTNTNPSGLANYTGASGSFAIADRNACGVGSVMTASMTTDPLDLTDALNPQVVFFMDYQDGDPNNGVATVDVSIDLGANWSNLFTWNESARGPQIVSELLPGAGENDVLVRWQLSNAITDTWWQVDDAEIIVCSPQPADIEINPTSLNSTQPPDAQTTQFLNISNVGTLELNWTIEESLTTLAPLNSELDILYDQTDSPGVNSISSQQYDPANAALNNQAADDFVIPVSDGAWAIQTIFVPGTYLSGQGQIPYVNVYFYADGGGLPGEELYFFDNIKPTADVGGDLLIDLRYPPILPTGTYWVSVQAKIFDPSDLKWGWTEHTLQTNAASAWRNPGGGLGTPCTDWGSRAVTCGIGTEPDLLFQLMGVSSNCALANIPWASVSPISGTVVSNGSELVTVTFDSTGLSNGVYNRNLCTTSNDPLEPFVSIPLELTVVSTPFLTLEKTVGTDPTTCAVTDVITVLTETDVTYCYKITNTGAVTITTHDLYDDQLGTLLSGYPLDVAPGDSAFITVTTEIRYDTINTATWTGYTIFGIPATGVDSATVLVVEPTSTPTATPTHTPTPTPTGSPTPTSSPTLTSTPTNTPAATPTSTNSPTPTATGSPMPTNSPTLTSTPTNSPTSTHSPTPTPTTTPTGSPTPTITPTTPPPTETNLIYLPIILRSNSRTQSHLQDSSTLGWLSMIMAPVIGVVGLVGSNATGRDNISDRIVTRRLRGAGFSPTRNLARSRSAWVTWGYSSRSSRVGEEEELFI